MKNLKLGIAALALTVASSVFAQTTSNPWLIGVGAHGVNHAAAKGGVGKLFDNLTGKHLFNINNYTITPPLSKLTVARNLGKGFVLDWQTSVGNIDNKRFSLPRDKAHSVLLSHAGSIWYPQRWVHSPAPAGTCAPEQRPFQYICDIHPRWLRRSYGDHRAPTSASAGFRHPSRRPFCLHLQSNAARPQRAAPCPRWI